MLQKVFINYPEFIIVTSLVVKLKVIHTLVTIGYGKISQLDVQNVFFYVDLIEEVYMIQHPGFVNPAFPNHVGRLRKEIYGPNKLQKTSSIVLAPNLLNKDSNILMLITHFHHSSSHITVIFLYIDHILLLAEILSHSTILVDLSSSFTFK